MEETDQDLVKKHINGDENALEILIERHLKHVYNFIYHMKVSPDESEDITQETFVKVWKNIKKYNSKQNFKTWIFTVAKNTAIDYFRKRKNIAFSEFAGDDDENYFENKLASEDISQLEESIMKEDEKMISKAVQKLLPIYQSILFLRYNEDMTFKEIGEILNKPLDTVKSQHRRALMQLKNSTKM